MSSGDDSQGSVVGWFALAVDACRALVAFAQFSVSRITRISSWDKKAVAVRLLLRASSNCQGVILMAEHGMTTEARILLRSLLEAGFCLAALRDSPDELIKMLKEDSEASRQKQRKFILAKNLISDPDYQTKINEIVQSVGNQKIMNLKNVAELGPLTKQYLAYQRLSDDSAHVSARSLDRYVSRQNGGWCYATGLASAEDNAATLHHLLLAVTGVGIAASEIVEDTEANAVFAAIAGRLQAMPDVGPV